MKIQYHLLIGCIGGFVFDKNFLIGALIIDIPLLFNEIKIRYYQQNFDPSEVSALSLFLYRITHSLLILIPIIYFNQYYLGMGVLIHQIMDWFTHQGIFETRIFFPISKKSIKELINNE